jgi:FtsP/CotA-like multicopper oxidase with cupredoxin domain
MKTRILFAVVLLLASVFAVAQTTIPTCNTFDATTGAPAFMSAGGTTTMLCTDYFGKANYANSPLPVGGIDISATGLTIMNGGSGYTAPTVAITDFYNTPGANGAAASVTIDPATGTILAVTGTAAGTGYVAPIVTIADPTGSGAVILARLDPATVIPGTGIRKFVPTDLLPALPIAGMSTGIPADTTTFPNSDYYEIALVEYTQQMHADLPPTKLRGYVQVPSGSAACPSAAAPQYLGPVILAQRDRPVRVKFTNCLPVGTGGNLFIPVDTTYMGAGNGPDGTSYTENRATLHLHGGATPWISDGTPHQWTAPASELTNFKKGVSTQNVPDMYFVGGVVVPQCSATVTAGCSGGTAAQLPAGATNDPGDGSMSFYWTNQQGGRLMFYHDHAYGLTRLNVYAGEAAGYLVYDPAEEAALLMAGVPGTIATNTTTQLTPDLAHLLPLVIQDKTFVPGASQLAGTDPTWIWGTGTATPAANGNGDLWFPHVYLPNQNPADSGGADAFGRWDYGAWFFPPQTTLSAAEPGPLGPNTAVTIPCTSAAFPGVVLQPTPANNYQEGCPITPNPSGTPESFMDTPLVNGKAYPVVHVAPAAYRMRILNASNDRTLNLSLYQACGSGTFSLAATNCSFPGATGTEIPLVPAVRGGAGTTGYVYPDQLDGRDSGVPDSTAGGPPFVQIGTEGGLLPAVAVVRPSPVGFEYNRRSITVLNVSTHGLLLGAAERADAIVDFRAFSGKTLILYNDAPAPVPAFDSRIDYYTGDPDQVSTGGAPTTIPGYGPNTRTIMQIVVDASAPNTATFTLAGVQAALPAIFSATNSTTPMQAIIPEPTYPVASGGNAPAATYGRISDNTITYTPLGATAPITINYDQKAIQELFTLDYGRMNATLGTELPLTNFLVQTTLPYGYAEWATEILKDSKDPTVLPQVWKLTHNGVDTHFIHFHLFNVQVINRIGWDGAVKPPDANELGWKDTVRMNPLEDIVVALQPVSQQIPFPLPDSIRSLDVTMADNMISPAISGIDPATGNAIPSGLGTTNAKVNFGWEYVWHCHILGHEENDMMRPIIFQVAPAAPSVFAAVRGAAGEVNLTWTDNSASESGFNLQRDTDPAFPAPATLLANTSASTPASNYGGTIAYTDSSAPAGPAYYRVQAEDDFLPQSPLAAPFQVSAMFSAWVTTTAGAATTTTIQAPPITYGQNGVVTVTVTSAAGTVTGNVTLAVDGGAPISQTLSGGVAAFTLLTPAVGSHALVATYAAQGTFAASGATGTLVVNQAQLTITASSATVAYGSAIPAITPTVVGLVNGDTITSLGPLVCSTTATQGSPVGTYPTTCSGAANANYAIVYVPGTVAITPVGLTITANNATRSFGVPNPALTATYAGFVNGDTAASLTGTLLCTTTATATSPAGTYPITCSGQTSNKYTITYVPGVLTVTPAGPVLTLQPTSLTFTSTPNVTSASQSVTVSNTGGAPLRITSINLGGANPGRFGFSQNCPIGGTGLAAGLTCTITVTFTPNNNTARSALVRVNVAAPATSGTITLTGRTIQPTVAVSPTSIAFGNVPINTTSAPQTVTVTNTGTVPLVITSITMGGANPTRFAQTSNCPIGGTGVPVGGSCSISVTFHPTRRAARSATLTIRDNAANSPQTVSLTGTGQ